MRKFLLAACLAGAALAFAGACADAHNAKVAASDSVAQKQGSPKPAAVKPTPDTSAPKISEIKEDGLKSLLNVGVARERPLLVNFWATWCVPCREEFPDLVKVREQYSTDRLDFITISLDDITDIDKAVPDFLREVHATRLSTYLLHASDEDTAIDFVDPTWHGELPATFLYDREGKIAFKHMGRVKLEELNPKIEQALSAKPAAHAHRQ